MRGGEQVRGSVFSRIVHQRSGTIRGPVDNKCNNPAPGLNIFGITNQVGMAGLHGVSGFCSTEKPAKIVIDFAYLYFSFKCGILRLLVFHDNFIAGNGLDGKEI
ncbi:hypothetical protein SDC9_125324 [bioreactor metagenome]|uniref:Uncharacterized protein n=1 Tax=bioreactor metagenome TaxID=1076179 RepID=A0A645CMY8_9ZZZZ